MIDVYALCDELLATTGRVKQLGTFEDVVGFYRTRFCALVALGPYRIPVSFVLMSVPERTCVGERLSLRFASGVYACQCAVEERAGSDDCLGVDEASEPREISPGERIQQLDDRARVIHDRTVGGIVLRPLLCSVR